MKDYADKQAIVARDDTGIVDGAGLSPPLFPGARMEQDQLPPPTAPTLCQKLIGAVLILVMNSMWVAAAELSQYIYQGKDTKYDKPLALSYISQTACTLYLVGFLLPSWRATWEGGHRHPHSDHHQSTSGPAIRFPMLYVFNLALLLTPCWVASSWTYNTGLKLTSVASSSIICAITPLFALFIAVAAGVERFSLSKLCAACVCIAGVFVIVRIDGHDPTDGLNPILGDFFSICSAIAYASFTVLLKKRAGPNGALNMPMLLGFIGLIVLLSEWPVIIIFDKAGFEQFQLPSPRIFGLLLGNAIIGSVLPTLLYALVIVLTTPLIAALSISLMVPMSIFWDLMAGKKKFSYPYFAGAVLVILGFVAVNLQSDNIDSDSDDAEEDEVVNRFLSDEEET